MIYRPLLWYFGSAAFGEVLAKSGGITGKLAGISLLLLVWFYLGEKGKQAGQNRLLWLLLPCFFALGFLRYGQAVRSFQKLPETWDKQTAVVTGMISRIEERQEVVHLILRDCNISEWEGAVFGGGFASGKNGSGQQSTEKELKAETELKSEENQEPENEPGAGDGIEVNGILVLWEKEELPEEFFTLVREGNVMTLEAELRLPKEKRNPGQFDGKAYYRAMGISGLAQGSRILEVSESVPWGRRGISWLRCSMRKLRKRLSEGIERVCGDEETSGSTGVTRDKMSAVSRTEAFAEADGKTADADGKGTESYTSGILKSIVLGEKWELNEEIKGLYEDCGIGHLLAISGLHVSLAGLGVFRLLRKRLGISYGLSALACMGMAGCYVILTGEGSSAARAALMLGVYVLGQTLGREYDVPSALGFAGLILILKNPFLLFQGGFQLSCASILALGILYPEMKIFADREMVKKQIPKRKRILKLLLPGLALQLVTWPVQACTFYQIPVYALLLNAIVLPLFSVTAVAGIICAVLGMFSGNFVSVSAGAGIIGVKTAGAGVVGSANLWSGIRNCFGKICFWIGRGSAMPADMILKLYQKLGTLSLKLPGAVWRTGEPGREQMIAYVILLALFYRWIRKKNREAREEERNTGKKQEKKIGEKAERKPKTIRKKPGKKIEKPSGKKFGKQTSVRSRKKLRNRGEKGRRSDRNGKLEQRLFWIIILCLPFCLVHIPKNALEVTFLDVGQGDSCFVRTPGGTTMLIDGGSSDEGKIGTYTLEPFLNSQAVGKLDLVFVSHGDSDHISGLKELLADGRIRCLVLPPGWENRKGLSELGEAAKEQGIEILELAKGDELKIGEVKVNCLWPEKVEEAEKRNDLNEQKNSEKQDGSKRESKSGVSEQKQSEDLGNKSEESENELSMVLWLSWRDIDVLFTGDLEGSGEAAVTELLKNPPEELAVCRRSLELLKVPHHGSGKTSSEEFLKAAEPDYAVISCGRKNRYGHPAKETLDRLEEAGCQILRTDEEGAVRFWFR